MLELSQKLERKGLGLQPVIIITGPTLEEINAAYVQVDNVRYHFNNVLAALDVCYKLIHVVGAAYSESSIEPWLLVQRSLYKYVTQNDYDFYEPTPTFLTLELDFENV